MKQVKNMIMTALCIAIGIILPVVFHSIPNAGSILLPMHIPVLLCGLMLGPQYGLACGALTPLLSSLVTGMPPAEVLPAMLCELAVYGLVSGLLMRVVHTKWRIANIYISLGGAMLCGRIVAGVLSALVFQVGEYSMQIWLSSLFIAAIPGIIIQLVLIPVLIMALNRAGVVNYGRQPQ